MTGRLAELQRALRIDAATALSVQILMRAAFSAGFEDGHYADPDPTVTRAQDEANRWNEWLSRVPADTQPKGM